MQKIYSKNEKLVPTSKSQIQGIKPRKHIVELLLNYSKSLEVTKFQDGKTILLNLN